MEGEARPVLGPVSGYREPEPVDRMFADERTLELLDQAAGLAGRQGRRSRADGRRGKREQTGSGGDILNGVSAAGIVGCFGYRHGLSFPRSPGSERQVTGWISPEPGPVTLLVASSAHGHVRVTGLARLFPARTVHARDCGVVVDGNDCELQSTDHYHVRTVNVSLEPLTRRGPAGKTALAALLRDPGDKGITRFQQAMRRLAAPSEAGDRQASLPVAATHTTVVESAAVVQHGDHSQTTLTSKYVIEAVELPVCDLLAADRELVVALIDAVLGPEGEPAAAFVREVLRVAECTDDLALLNYSTELHGAESSAAWLFGLASVTDAPVVLLGDGNQLHTDLHVEPGEYALGGGLAAFGRIRREASELRVPSMPEGESPAQVGWVCTALLGPADSPGSLPSPADLLQETPWTTDSVDTAAAVRPPFTGFGTIG